MGIHDGHRERLRSRVEKYGLESLEDHEKLEFLLFSFIPRRDTNPIAHELLSTFGSLRGVLDSEPEQLASIKGMTQNAALFLHCLPDAFAAYALSEKAERFDGIIPCAEYLTARIGGKNEEHFLTMYLDDGCRLLQADDVTSRKNRSVVVDRDKIVANAVKCGAKYVVLGHNHPNGTIAPSVADVDATNRIVQALGVVNVTLGDHIIVSGGEYYSMKVHGDIVGPVNLNGSVYQFAESLVRRENDVNRLRLLKNKQGE